MRLLPWTICLLALCGCCGERNPSPQLTLERCKPGDRVTIALLNDSIVQLVYVRQDERWLYGQEIVVDKHEVRSAFRKRDHLFGYELDDATSAPSAKTP
jgi:hypothetical protein